MAEEMQAIRTLTRPPRNPTPPRQPDSDHRSAFPRLGHRPALDGVRGLAILGVLVVHTNTFGGWPNLIPGGHLGVVVFFVLSGFLITTLLLEEYEATGNISLRGFYLRRAARLLPALLLLLPFHALVWGFRVSPTEVALSILPVVLYVSNIVRANAMIPLYGTSWTWSLAVEEQFYMGWPPLLRWLLSKRWGLWIPMLACLAVIIFSCSFRAVYANEPLWHGYLYYATESRIDGLAFGCLAALVLWQVTRHPIDPHTRLGAAVQWCLRLPGGTRWLEIAGWLGLIWLGYSYRVYDNHLNETFSFAFPTAALAAVMVVLAVVTRPTGWLARLLSNRVLVRFGMLSYGLYLWNLLPIQAWRIFYEERPGRLATAGCLVVTYIAAELSFRFVERPIIRWAKSKTKGDKQTKDDKNPPRSGR